MNNKPDIVTRVLRQQRPGEGLRAHIEGLSDAQKETLRCTGKCTHDLNPFSCTRLIEYGSRALCLDSILVFPYGFKQTKQKEYHARPIPTPVPETVPELVYV